MYKPLRAIPARQPPIRTTLIVDAQSVLPTTIWPIGGRSHEYQAVSPGLQKSWMVESGATRAQNVQVRQELGWYRCDIELWGSARTDRGGPLGLAEALLQRAACTHGATPGKSPRQERFGRAGLALERTGKLTMLTSALTWPMSRKSRNPSQPGVVLQQIIIGALVLVRLLLRRKEICLTDQYYVLLSQCIVHVLPIALVIII